MNLSNLTKYIGSNLLIKAFVFFSQIFVAFFITPEELGEVKTAQAMVEIFSLLACLGMNASILATAPKVSEQSKREVLYSQVMSFNLCSSLFVVLVLMGVLWSLQFFGWSVPITMYQLMPLIIMMSVTTLLVSFIQSEKAFGELAKGQLLAKLISIPMIVFSCFMYGLLGYIIALYLAAAVTIVFLLRAYGLKMTLLWKGVQQLKLQWKVAKGALLSNVLGTFGFYAGLFITNAVIDEPKLVGSYAFALIIISGFEVISRSVQQYYIPHFSSEFSHENLTRIENKFTLLAGSLIIPIVFFLLIITYVDINFKYSDAVCPFLVLFLSWVMSFKYNLKAGYFISCGKTMLNFKASIVNVSLTILLSFYLGYMFGLVGIAIARLVTVIVLIVVYRKLYELS
ncbi:oligosaccharide flippase family protein [Vibrio splendidus]|uniref:oligosaccharide flippase family protein n=1 Tax=Vibrio splendidus TaxID=29497 RepID=UPI000C81A5D4|nr:oligosaccharide flippase family protein [Vibrio splendidus]PMO23506.1 hypothetical protein BCT15_02415 [Vibrio splendidus]